MKCLKYILSILFVFLSFLNKTEAKVITIENEKIESFSEQELKDESAEKEWLTLLCLQEKSTNQNQNSFSQFSSEGLFQNFSRELCLKSVSKILESSFQVGRNSKSHQGSYGINGEVFHGSPELVDAWKKMDQLGADDVLRRNPGALEASNSARL